MSEFIVYPAIDLREGKVVRLRQGKGDQQTVYSDDPESVALGWIEQGAEWLHVVNLNGAFGESITKNQSAIDQIIRAAEDKVDIQLGGGIRTEDQIAAALSMGVSRVVLGTAVIENPQFGIQVLDRFGSSRIAFGFDALGQELMSRGWQINSGHSMHSLAEELAQAGAETLIYTNIKRDGMQTGVDWESTLQLADKSNLRVIASGGTASLADISKVKSSGLAGVIVGRALYEEKFTLEEALCVR